MDGPSCKCGLKKFCFCCLVWTADLWWCLPPVTPEAPDWWMLRGHPGTWDRKEFRKLKGENEFWASSPVATNRQKSMLQIFDFILLIIISLGHPQHYFDFSMPEKWHIILLLKVSKERCVAIPSTIIKALVFYLTNISFSDIWYLEHVFSLTCLDQLRRKLWSVGYVTSLHWKEQCWVGSQSGARQLATQSMGPSSTIG